MASSQYFLSRWHAQIPLNTIFWRDLLLIGTLLNVAVLVASLIAVAAGFPPYIALVAHILLVPYNLFLMLSVWRWPGVNVLFKSTAGGWFLMTVFL